MGAAVEVWTLAGRSTIELDGTRATIGTAPENAVGKTGEELDKTIWCSPMTER